MHNLIAPVINKIRDEARSKRRWAYVIGTGVALFPIHNKWLTDATSINGMPTAFIPAFATVVWLMATLLFLRDNWKCLDWGDRRVAFLLVIIAAAMGMSGATAATIGGRLAPLFMGVSLLALYLVSRSLGSDVFTPLAIGTVVASLGIILYSVLHPGRPTGGFIFERNFDIATGYIVLGAILFRHRYQWVLVLLAAVALALSGAPEAVFVVGVLFLVVILRRDRSRRLWIAIGVVVVLVGAGLWSGWLSGLYGYTREAAVGGHIARYDPVAGGPAELVSPLEIRWLEIRDAAQNLKPLGEGYNITNFTPRTVHNVPLILIQQLGWPGILAALAWIGVTVWCLLKTRWKYAWIAVLALSVFDHYLWTQLCPLWWILAGVSTSSTPESDLIFRKAAR